MSTLWPLLIILSLLKPPVTNTVHKTQQTPTPSQTGLITQVTFQDKRYIVCKVDPRKYIVEVYNHLQNNGLGYTFTTIEKLKKGTLVFAMNAGMYEMDFSPVGLFVSGGKTYKDINLAKDRPGNFYQLMPNGVFIVDKQNTPHIITSENYASIPFKVRLATQSGPMLVIDSAINSNFKERSTNVNIRNGIGVSNGKVVFVISKDPVNFYEFAQLFKTELHCNNALYMDGVVSQYYIPEPQAAQRPGALLGTYITVRESSKK